MPLDGEATDGHFYRRSRFNPETCFAALRTPVRFLRGVGPKRAEQLKRIGVATVEDLLYHVPFRYEDRREILKIAEARIGSVASVIGRLATVERKHVPRRRSVLTATLTDDTGTLELVWYRVPAYLAKGLTAGLTLWVRGKIEAGWRGGKRLAHPDFAEIGPDGSGAREEIAPVYLRPAGLSSRSFCAWQRQALSRYAAYLPSFLPEVVARNQKIDDLESALRMLHEPLKSTDVESLNRFTSRAHRSVIFDEFFYLQLGLGLRRRRRSSQSGVAIGRGKDEFVRRMRSLLPFALTAAQERVLAEIDRDIESGRPMQRLLQGDVGSGKTIVAWLASLRIIGGGFQAAWMAPTELLAEQHFRNLREFAGKLKIQSALLTSSTPRREKVETLRGLASGEIRFVVGTHALIQEEVRFRRLGFGLIDEQHRFGVMQRKSFQRFGGEEGPSTAEPRPHILIMSATPIPRSLAMVLYGDMEVSVLDQMPPGRTPVETLVYVQKERSKAYEAALSELRGGRQIYVVYPLVEPSAQVDLRAATQMYEELRAGPFARFRVGLLHGRMSAQERDQVMRRFGAGELQALVATTVIEVGIDVPNATLMIVEHAERFGLSQLHQLRGRVGRGEHRSRCVLVHYGAGPTSWERVKTLAREADGFKIAEADLALRGPGELLGIRQSGLADFRVGTPLGDASLLVAARREALAWLDADPLLARSESAALRCVLSRRWGGKLELGEIG
jgi:ATP-dependent DNA helicase RecG